MMIFLILKFWIFLKNSVYILRFSLINGNLEEKIFPRGLFFLLVSFFPVYYTIDCRFLPHPITMF